MKILFLRNDFPTLKTHARTIQSNFNLMQHSIFITHLETDCLANLCLACPFRVMDSSHVGKNGGERRAESIWKNQSDDSRFFQSRLILINEEGS